MIILNSKKCQTYGVKAKMPDSMLKIRFNRFLNRDKLRKLITRINKESIYNA